MDDPDLLTKSEELTTRFGLVAPTASTLASITNRALRHFIIQMYHRRANPLRIGGDWRPKEYRLLEQSGVPLPQAGCPLQEMVDWWWAAMEPIIAKHIDYCLEIRRLFGFEIAEGWLEREKEITREWAKQETA